MIRLLPLAGVIVSSDLAIAQGYAAVGGSTVESVLNRVFPSHAQLAKNARFAMTLRYLPPFAPESQIGMAYGLDSKVMVAVTSISKAVNRTVNEAVATGRQTTDIAALASLIQARTQKIALDGASGRQWLAAFWNSVSALARTGPAAALKHDGTPEIEVTLDPTIYEVEYTDPENAVRIRVQGPDPEWSGDIEKVDPLVKWMLLVRRQVLKLTSVAQGENGGVGRVIPSRCVHESMEVGRTLDLDGD